MQIDRSPASSILAAGFVLHFPFCIFCFALFPFSGSVGCRVVEVEIIGGQNLGGNGPEGLAGTDQAYEVCAAAAIGGTFYVTNKKTKHNSNGTFPPSQKNGWHPISPCLPPNHIP